MITLAFLVSLVMLQETQAEKIVCDGLVVHQVYYDKEALFTGLGRPCNLVMHKFSGLLFFSHTIQNGTHVDFVITSCHLDKRNCFDVTGVPGGYAIAYDPGHDDIYFGGHDGIYKFNFLTKAAEFFAEEGRSVWDIFVKTNFYYIEYPSQKLLVYQDDDFVPVLEASGTEIDHFFISKHLDVYFSNRTALYKVEKPKKTAMVLTDEIVVRQIVEDGYGDIYFCASDGFYIEDKPYHRTKQIAHISQAFGLTFDEHDNIMYSDQDSIYRLLPSKVGNICYEILTKPLGRAENSVMRELIIS